MIGDAVYGGGLTPSRRARLNEAAVAAVAGLGRQALHAHALGFEHPATRELMEFHSNLPNELNALKNLLEVI